jgi:hypothetical protein
MVITVDRQFGHSALGVVRGMVDAVGFHALVDEVPNQCMSEMLTLPLGIVPTWQSSLVC